MAPGEIVEFVSGPPPPSPLTRHGPPVWRRTLTDSTVGAGDTFIAVVLYRMTAAELQPVRRRECGISSDTMRSILGDACRLATAKITRAGFEGLAL